ncbi:porin [Zavarzinia sp. CC-PAN008]|uniref:porin n=1 Tax=Zavarzinia sp. CC-PAN008 TaxID=3243332 RepID=UPI003F743EA9
MKRILLGSTALAGMGMAISAAPAMAQDATEAEPIKLSVGGYFRAFATYIDQDDSLVIDPATGAQIGNTVRGSRNHSFEREGEIHFKGSTTLPTLDLTFGVRVELEAQSSTDQIDDTYMFVEGAFGTIEFGDHDGVAAQMGYTSPAAGASLGLNSPNWWPNSPDNALTLATTYNNWTADQTKINYFTPRIAGFQFGVSYVPDGCKAGNQSGTRCRPSGFTESEHNQGQQSEVMELGLNYTNTFGDVDLALSGTYAHGNVEDGLFNGVIGGDSNTPGFGVTDRESYSFGANVAWGGFTLGGSYYADNLGRDDSNRVVGAYVQDLEAFDLGLTYGTGPWSVGIQYINSTVEIKNEQSPLGNLYLGEQSLDAWGVSGGYNLGPGVDLAAAIYFYDYADRSGLTGVAKSLAENDATQFLLGTVLRF